MRIGTATLRCLLAAGGVGVQLADLQQRQGFEGRMRRKMATVPPPKVAAQRRIQELLDDASRDPVSTEKLPGVVALIAEYPFDIGIDSEVLYRVLSAFAHGKMWGLLILSSVLEEGEVTAVAGVARTRLMAQGWATEFLTRWAVGYVTTAADELIAYST